MKKQLFLLALFLISQIGVFSQDPFEKYGYKPRIHTLSNEKYQEFFDNEDVVRIGTALFNTQTNKIVGYVEDDSAMSQKLETELASRWLSLDPMAEEYPSWSPYNYAVNNPINNYDPNGKWVESFLDIGFILYDLGEMAYDYAKTGSVNSVSVAALGADVACLIAPVATGGGLAIRAAREGGEQMAKHIATEVVTEGAEKVIKESGEKGGQKTYQTYTKANEKTGEIYSGRTSGNKTPIENVAARDKNHHMNDKGYGPAKLDKSSPNKDAIRGREQQNINKNGGAKSQNGTSGNSINGVGSNNKKAEQYKKAAENEFRK